MTDPEAGPPEEYLATLRAACDEALAVGSSVADAIAAEVPARLRPRLERDAAWCHFVRRVLTAPPTADDAEAEADADDVSPAPPPSRIGRFEVRGELGRGAFGVVFLAYDPRLRRLVALKVPRPEVLADPELRARFRREGRVAAGLDHPNLVPVFDAGEDGPICYIASAYCPGVNLAVWLRQLDRPVPVRAAARLLATIAGAVEHAHRHGVLHRDLKPSNVMLDPDAPPGTGPGADPDGLGFVPRVTDFGLAKILDAGADGATWAGQTQAGAIVGTPAYMAPEQAGGPSAAIGPAADVYALGAILYEVLTGRPLFQAETPVDALLLVRHEPPVPPRRLRPGVPRALETVCLSCLAKDPSRRYAGAGALADDLNRFLAGEPVRARPAPLWWRAWAWARRRPSRATLAAVSALAAAVVLAVVVQSNVLLRRERNDSDVQRRLAQANFRQAQQAVNRMLTRVVTDRLKDIPRMEPVARALLEDALEFNRGFVLQAGENREVRFEASRAYRRLAGAYRWLGPRGKAEPCYREAVALLERLTAGTPSSTEYAAELAACRCELGATLMDAGRLAEVRGEYLAALHLQERLVAAHPAEPAHRAALAATHNALGAYWGESGLPREQESEFRAALAILDDLTRHRPGVQEYQTLRARVRNNLATTLEERLPVEAETLYRDNLRYWQGLAFREPDVVDHRGKAILTLQNLADLLNKTSRAPEAEAALRKAVDLSQKITDEFPDSPFRRRRMADGLHALADVVAGRGDRDEARRLLERAIRHRRAAVTADPAGAADRRALRSDLAALVEALIALRDHAAAAAAVAELPDIDPASPDGPLEAGSFLARIVSLPALDAALARHYAALASNQIGTAVRRGLRDVAALASDPRFESLWDRPEFLRLLRKPIGKVSETR